MAAALALTLGGAACSGSNDDDDSGGATDETGGGDVPADMEPGGTIATGAENTAPGTVAPADEESAATGRAGDDVVGPLELGAPLSNRQIAVEARATLRTGDVRAAVDGVTATVAAQGGMVASASVDYAPELTPDDEAEAQATIVVKVPPASLESVVDRLSDFGTVTGFDQLAEDVTERLTDLETRIDNQRQSIARLRGLLAEAANVDVLLKVEGRLTDAELELEQLLASERNLDARVQMSTLTIDVIPVVAGELVGASTEVEADPGIVEALSGGWTAFVGVLFTIVFGLAAAAPFIALALVAAVLGLALHRTVTGRQPARPVDEPSDRGDVVSASRPE